MLPKFRSITLSYYIETKKMLASLLQELNILDCAVMVKNQDNSYRAIHSNTTWFSAIFPRGLNGEVTPENNNSVYLTDFLYDANKFWTSNLDGRINSGIWSEQTSVGLWRLEASAITQDDKKYLVIINLENEYNIRQSTLQLARELLISNDKVLEQHELIYKRIESLTYNLSNKIDLHSPIKELMEHCEFGIAMIDANMQPLAQNPALFHIFDIRENDSIAPIDIILDLCHRQFPEFQRVLNTQKKWNSEIYWIKPDTVSRWLHITICPVKDINTKLTYWLLLVTDISRVKYLQQSNEKLTYFDVMTDLPNRQFFWQSLENAMTRNSSLFVLQINIKHIKRINEAYGYAAGDEVIKTVVARLKPIIGEQSILARLGGNEFAIILYKSNEEECELVAKRLINAACEPINIINQNTCKIGLSIGASHYQNDVISAQELMRNADLAAFFGRDKKNQSIHFYSEALRLQSLRRIELEAALRVAIEDKQFELFLQPIYDLQSGNVIKAEALIRWNKPNQGLILPDVFIPIAEQTGLIVAIGQWVIKESIKLLEILHKQNIPITLSVNLSPIQIRDQQLLGIITNRVTKSEIDVASFLELELTEGVLVDDFETVQVFLTAVRKLGITIAIDDFGTGYSSLSYLQKLPIDHLKIDRSFIQELSIGHNQNAIVLAILAMAKSLNLGVIAEGVENETQQEFLRQNSCQSAQGYLFSRPLSFKQFINASDHWSTENKRPFSTLLNKENSE